MISIPLFWWYIPIILFLIPIIYEVFRESGGYIDFDPLGMVLLPLCWGSALSVCATKFFIWLAS